jgi:hypothetical protein
MRLTNPLHGAHLPVYGADGRETMGWHGGWADALSAADDLRQQHPGWRVRAVRRRNGPGIEAVRGAGNPCSLTGTADEVRAGLDEAPLPKRVRKSKKDR